MATVTPALGKVIEKHLQELGFLWGQRRDALRSPDYRLPDVKRLDGRIEAHLDGLRIAGRIAPELLAAHLETGDAETIFAAALGLLQLETPAAAAALMKSLLKARPGQVKALRQALVHGPIKCVEEPLRQAVDSARPHVAAAALEALAFHDCKDLKRQRLAEFAGHEDPTVRCAAWRIVALGDPANHA
jgi:uncharacterized protein (TIGR02270 family)